MHRGAGCRSVELTFFDPRRKSYRLVILIQRPDDLEADRHLIGSWGRTQGGATEAYSQYVDERRASTARDGAQLAVVVENPMNNPG